MIVHACCVLWASQWALVWFHVMGPVPLSIGSGSPMSPSGVSYSESPESGSISSSLWGCATCISKFLWTTQVHPSPCHGLIVYTGRFGCCSTTTYLYFPAITYHMLSPKYFLSYQTEVPWFKLGGFHFSVIPMLMVGKFHTLVWVS